jgi:hypothetical protein
MQVATKLRQALPGFDADLRAGGFCRNSRGLARELYASFAATVVAHQTEAETLTWVIGRSLAIDLDAAGASQSARTLLVGLIELGEDYPNAKSLELLRETKEAIERRMVRPNHAAAGAPSVIAARYARRSRFSRERPNSIPLAWIRRHKQAVTDAKGGRESGIRQAPPAFLETIDLGRTRQDTFSGLEGIARVHAHA